MKTPSLIIALFLALVMSTGAEDKPKFKDKTKSRETTKSKGDPKDKDKPASDNGLESIGSLIPEGVKNLKVKIPGFDQGRPSSLVTAETMTRLNANEMFGETVVIHLYGKLPKDNMRVDLKTATYHMDTKILISKDRTKITRSDFTIEGDSVVYDTTTSKGDLKGNVHMVIFNSSKMAPKEQPTATATVTPPQSNP